MSTYTADAVHSSFSLTHHRTQELNRDFWATKDDEEIRHDVTGSRSRGTNRRRLTDSMR